MVASQAGLPILPRGVHFQSMIEDLPSFMPGHVFLGDVLAEMGYASHYVVGGETDFGGISAMYATHQITEMAGLPEQQAMYPAAEFEAAKVHWFRDDQMVLDTARRIHRDLARGQAIRSDRRGGWASWAKGYLSRRWTDSGKAEVTRDIPRVVAGKVDEVLEFLQHIRAAQSAREREPRVVLISDHLNHVPRLPKVAPGFAGFNTVILWGDPARKGEVIDKPGSMIDVFPTLLDWLAWSKGPVAAGLGRSVPSAPPTLVEEFGIAAVDVMIVGDALLSKLL